LDALTLRPESSAVVLGSGEDEEDIIRGMQEHFGLGRLAVSTRQRFEAAVRVSGIESLWRQVTQMSDAFRKLMLASFCDQRVVPSGASRPNAV
jgi:hypothetical protein